ncbi:hypothetical protein B0H16DRAFT_1885839 [Mycena metata]|uniref:Uncharacterized protein n=1 Tax=Mycena metata TaxID=1033252 RepID=A0AAD7NDB8_9AGAR|nr:hypothetical protein B0H16DRAFT_1885839 [Mycena metata]
MSSSSYTTYPYRHTSRFSHPGGPLSMLPVRFPMDSVEDQIQDLLLLSQAAAAAQPTRPGMVSRIFRRIKDGARRGLKKVKELARRH